MTGLEFSSIYGTDYMNNLTQTQSTEKLQSTLGTMDDATDEELMEACKSFESYFIEQVLKAMEKTTGKTEEDGDYVEVFKDNLYQEYAKMITDTRSLGLAQQFYDSIKRNSISEETVTDVPQGEEA